MKIEIEGEGNDWIVRCGDRAEDRLAQEEALWCVAQLLMGHSAKFLRTDAEREAFRAQLAGNTPTLEIE